MQISEFRHKFNYGILNPMMQQYVDIKYTFQDGLLLFRLGDFYELFFEDAKIASELLGLVLTSRTKGSDAEVPMCGMPFHALESYLSKLIASGHKVAICEQLESPLDARKRGGKIVRRGIVQVFTPGTLVDESMVDALVPNYLVAVSLAGSICSVCFVDIGGCDIGVFDFPVHLLESELKKLQPKEILVSRKDFEAPELFSILSLYKKRVIVQANSCFGLSKAECSIKSFYSIVSTSSIGELSNSQLCSIGAVLDYLTITCNAGVKLPLPKIVNASEFMLVDLTTQRNLELFESSSTEHSLFKVLNCTVTKPGSRMLFKYLKNPLAAVEPIKQRLDVTEFFHSKEQLLERVRANLALVPDLERSLARISLGRAQLSDFVAVNTSLKVSESLRALFAREGSLQIPLLLESILDGMHLAPNLRQELEAALKTDDLPLNISDGGFIRPGYHARLDELRKVIDSVVSEQARLRIEYVRSTGVDNLKIQQNNLIGMFVEVPIKQAHKVGQGFTHKQTILSSVRFSTPELSALEGKLREAEAYRAAIELEILGRLSELIRSETDQLQSLGKSLAQIDLFCSLASCALKSSYVKPEVIAEGETIIKSGRHPVVEAILSKKAQQFIANDCKLSDLERVWLITGPNMGGKSTFMRQVALIIVMAQIGSFVPADFAKIAAVDKLFCRIGASDDIARGQSTFMLEMCETASILAQATPRSFILLDEVGRGTSTYDGVSIAAACVEYVASELGSRCLFATHYHELTRLEGSLAGVVNYTVAVEEVQAHDVVFLYRLQKGVAMKSYGIHVAKIAGLPKPLLRRAESILEQLEASNSFL